ncbi:MAG: hypothetical protein FWE05_04695 [Defluviitaleaceae bacterium]|nr:hypothetical protein [Defluviitaleaceae bacterium]
MTNEIINGVEILIEPTEKYIQINDATEDDLRGLWPKVLERYSGHNAMLCFRNTVTPVQFMDEIGAKLLDDSLEMRLNLEDFESFLKAVIADVGVAESALASVSVVGVTPITSENFDIFATHHDKTIPDMYWNSRRILEKIDLWRIFACFEGESITDYAMLMQPASEIFCCISKDTDRAKAILAAAAQEAFVSGAEELLYMIDKSEEICKNAASALGFRLCGYYQGFNVRIS